MAKQGPPRFGTLPVGAPVLVTCTDRMDETPTPGRIAPESRWPGKRVARKSGWPGKGAGTC